MAIQRIHAEKCVGCRSCERACPADVIRYDAKTHKAVVLYPDECMLCLWCVSLCSASAIELTHTKTKPLQRCW